jgi:hypothetical protein
MRTSLLRAAAAALLVPAIVLTVGCAKKTVVGKWKGTIEAPMAGSVTATIEYKEDGTMTQSATTAMGQINVTGTYKVEGENIALTVTDLTSGGRSVMAMLPPAAKSSLNSTSTFKLEGDQLTLTSKGKNQTFTRVKE